MYDLFYILITEEQVTFKKVPPLNIGSACATEHRLCMLQVRERNQLSEGRLCPLYNTNKKGWAHNRPMHSKYPKYMFS